MSDLHLGKRQYGLFEREQDFYSQLDKCVKELNKHDCDIVIIAGDIFDRPNPSPEAIHHYLDKVGNLDTDVIIAIKGNHTMVLRDSHYSVDNLIADDGDMVGYYLLDDERWNFNDFALESPYDMEFCKWKDVKINIDGITYRSPSDIDEFLEVQDRLASQKCEPLSFNVLVVHQSFKEFCGFTGEELSINDLDLSPYHLVICGHIHARTDVLLPGNTLFIQPGSIERLNTEEALDEINNGKGVYVVDTVDTKWEFYPIKCEREFIMGSFDVDGEEAKILEESLQKRINECELEPVVAIDFDDSGTLWEVSKNLKNVLINNSRVRSQMYEVETSIITEEEIPPVKEAVKQVANKKLPKEEAALCIDLFETLVNNNEDAEELLDKFFKKNYKNDIKEEKVEVDPEIQEIYDYFENLGV